MIGFFNIITKIAAFTLLIASVSVFFSICLLRLSSAENENFWSFFQISLGLGPCFLSWILTQSVRILPGHSNYLYMGIMYMAALIIIVLGWDIETLRKLRTHVDSSIRNLLSWSKLEKGLGVLLVTVILVHLYLSVFSPVTENDAVQYIVVARMIFKKHSLSFYPVIKPLSNGFYAVSSHPVGFLGLYFLVFLLQGGAHITILVKLFSPLYVIFTVVAIWGVLKEYRPLYPLLASLILICTPCYFAQSSQLSIDSYRMYLLFVAIIWVLELSKKHKLNRRFAIATGVVAGLSMYSHSIGLLFTLPLGLPLLLFYKHGSWKQCIGTTLIILAVALLIGGYRLVANILMFGSPIYDSLPVYKLENIRYDEYVWFSSGLLDGRDKIIKGVLKGFSNLAGFGWSYWFAFFMLAIHVMKNLKDLFNEEFRILTGCLAVIIIFYSGVVLSYLLGLHVFIANFRYLMTVQPFIAVVGAFFLGMGHDKIKSFS